MIKVNRWMSHPCQHGWQPPLSACRWSTTLCHYGHTMVGNHVKSMTGMCTTTDMAQSNHLLAPITHQPGQHGCDKNDSGTLQDRGCMEAASCGSCNILPQCFWRNANQPWRPSMMLRRRLTPLPCKSRTDLGETKQQHIQAAPEVL
jgi:hypothetical protein